MSQRDRDRARARIYRATSEEDIQRAFTEALSIRGWRWTHFRPAKTRKGPRTALSGNAGFVDVVAVRGRRALFVEAKSETGTLTSEQERWAEALTKAGLTHRVLRPSNLNELLEFIE